MPSPSWSVAPSRQSSAYPPTARGYRAGFAWRFHPRGPAVDGHRVKADLEIPTFADLKIPRSRVLWVAVGETKTDCEHGAGATRQAFADAGRTLLAKLPMTINEGLLPQDSVHLRFGRGDLRLPSGADHERPTDNRGLPATLTHPGRTGRMAHSGRYRSVPCSTGSLCYVTSCLHSGVRASANHDHPRLVWLA